MQNTNYKNKTFKLTHLFKLLNILSQRKSISQIHHRKGYIKRSDKIIK